MRILRSTAIAGTHLAGTIQLKTAPHPAPMPQMIRLRQTTGYGGQAAALAPASPPKGRGAPDRTVILPRPLGGEAGPAFPRLREGRVRGRLISQLYRSGLVERAGRSFHFFFYTLLPVLLCLGALSCARPRPPVKARPLPPPVQPSPSATEVRAVWVSDTTKLDWEAATRELQRAGFNTMYVNFASAGAALYPASLVLPSVAGQIDGDPVARGIELAHRRGIAVQAKMVVMFAFRSPAEFQAKLVKTDRTMRGIDGKPILQSGSVWICPSHPANRHAALAALAEFLHRYPVDGLQFDYLRYNEEPSCFCKHCRESFEHALGKPVRHWPADVLNGEFTKQFNDWRQSVINDWARQLSATARQARPGLKITAAVFPVLERAREEKAQDWRLWLERGYVDAICPMNYTTNAHDFEERCRGVLKYAPRDRVVMGVAEWKFQQLDELNRQVALCRQLGLAGFALFSYDDATVRHFLPALDLH